MVRISYIIALVLSTTGLFACTAAYVSGVTQESLKYARLRDHYHVERNADWLVRPDTPVYLAKPHDIQQKNRYRHLAKLYHSLDLSVRQSFPAYSTPVTVLSMPEIFADAISVGSELLFIPKLVTTEDRRNGRQELLESKAIYPDKKTGTDEITFQVLIYEVRTRKLIDVVTIFGRSPFFSSTQKLPLDLFEQAALHFTNSITG